MNLFSKKVSSPQFVKGEGLYGPDTRLTRAISPLPLRGEGGTKGGWGRRVGSWGIEVGSWQAAGRGDPAVAQGRAEHVGPSCRPPNAHLLGALVQLRMLSTPAIHKPSCSVLAWSAGTSPMMRPS